MQRSAVAALLVLGAVAGNQEPGEVACESCVGVRESVLLQTSALSTSRGHQLQAQLADWGGAARDWTARLARLARLAPGALARAASVWTPRPLVNNENCVLHDANPSALGHEDLVAFTKDILLTGEVDLHTLWGDDDHAGDPLNTPDGNLVAIDASDPTSPIITRMVRQGFPAGVAFNPHGMYFLPESNLLHVVNHAYSRGGERIDVFEISAGANGTEATWLYAWTNDFFNGQAMGVLNDLAVVDADHLFVTRYMPSEAEEGRAKGASSAFAYDWVFFGSRNTEFYYCTRDPVSDTSTCEVADDNFGMANGINWGNDAKTLLYVNDVFFKELRVYHVDPQANNQLTAAGALPLLNRADNIEWNPFQQRMFLGTILGGMDQEATGGGADELFLNADQPTSNAGLTMLVMDDGSTLKGVASANYANGYMFLGSHNDNGLLVCPVTLSDPSSVKEEE